MGAYSPNTWWAAAGSGVEGQPGLCSDPVSKTIKLQGSQLNSYINLVSVNMVVRLNNHSVV